MQSTMRRLSFNVKFIPQVSQSLATHYHVTLLTNKSQEHVLIIINKKSIAEHAKYTQHISGNNLLNSITFYFHIYFKNRPKWNVWNSIKFLQRLLRDFFKSSSYQRINTRCIRTLIGACASFSSVD